MKTAHPTEMLTAFLKEAAEVMRPSGVGDVGKAERALRVMKKNQTYAQPNPAAAQTNPDLISSQKAVPPPPVQ